MLTSRQGSDHCGMAVRSVVLVLIPVCVQGFVGHRANTLLHSPPRRHPWVPTLAWDYQRSHLSSPDEQEPIKLRRLSSITSKLVPPIPTREVAQFPSSESYFDPKVLLQSLKKQFRPKFVRDEFEFGFLYMCRMLPWLFLASFLCDFLRDFCLPARWQDPEYAITMVGEPLHTVPGLLLHVGFRKLIPPSIACSQNWAYTTIIGPVEEELIYRGLAHAYGWWYGILQCLVAALICRWSAVAGCMERLVSVIGTLLAIGQKLAKPDGPEITASLLRHLIQQVIFIPVLWQLVLLKRNKRNYVTLHARETTREGESQCKKLSRYLSAVITGRIIPIPNSLEFSICIFLPLFARLFGAAAFGAAHGFHNVSIPFAYGLAKIQKCFGTFASSMLVESRLVSKRRTLWGAIGAHVAFNAIFPGIVNFVGNPLLVLYSNFIAKTS